MKSVSFKTVGKIGEEFVTGENRLRSISYVLYTSSTTHRKYYLDTLPLFICVISVNETVYHHKIDIRTVFRGLKILFSNIPKGKPTLYIMEGENKMLKYMSGKIIYTNSMDKKVFVNYQDSSQLICF